MRRFSKSSLVFLPVALVATLLVAGCGDGRSVTAIGPPDGVAPPDAVGPPEAPARIAAACQDFFSHANADWLAATPTPSGDEPSDLSTGVEQRHQQGLLDALAADLAADAGQAAMAPASHRALLTLHRSALDRPAVERAGLAPLASSLALIDRLAVTGELPAVIGALLRRGVPMPLRLVVEPFDDTEAQDAPSAVDRLRVSLEPAEAALAPPTDADPDRIDAFSRHVARTLVLLGDTAPQASAGAARVVAMEQRLRQLQAEAGPGDEKNRFDVQALAASAGIPAALPLRVDDDVPGVLSALAAEFDAEAWRGFLRWRLATGMTPYLPARFIAERDDWDHGPRPLTIDGGFTVDSRIALLSVLLPQALDRYFVDRLLPARTAGDLDAIARAVRAALGARIDSRAWLGASSRAASHRTLDTLAYVFPVLLPDPAAAATARADDALAARLRPDTLLANVLAASEHAFDRRMALAAASRTSTDLQGTAWWSNGPSYNVRSHRVLVPPVTAQLLLGVASDDAGRYGSLGTVLAHETMHAFGAPADLAFSPGQSLTWLDAADRPHVDAMVARLKTDYAEWTQAHYRLSPPGQRFMGEDLSDVASLPIALDALALAHPGSSATAFFTAYAASLRIRQSPAATLDFIANVPAHALNPYRVNGALSNLPAFALAYGCRADDAMVRNAAQRVDLW
ncbi:hypothetical protein GN316_16905 [Xylophilus sp. Kf1]|nr:hypothetical protein [Xylophilus sp. Kf1]